ncbi:MAG: hypothetical protein WA725_07315, partial [Pseudolabrys sp.]
GLEDAFVEMNKAAAQALSLTDPILFGQRKRTVDLASEYKLPAVYFYSGFVEEGGLMSYGPSDVDLGLRGLNERVVNLPVDEKYYREISPGAGD